MSQNLNINQEQMVPVVGEIDILTTKMGLISVLVDSTQATPLKTGQFVKFVTTNTGPLPKVVAAGVDDEAAGQIVYNVKQSQYSAGDIVDIMFFGGNVVWAQATAFAINPGTQLQSDATGLLVEAYTAHKVRAIALDYFAANGMGRMIQVGALRSA